MLRFDTGGTNNPVLYGSRFSSMPDFASLVPTVPRVLLGSVTMDNIYIIHGVTKALHAMVYIRRMEASNTLAIQLTYTLTGAADDEN